MEAEQDRLRRVLREELERLVGEFRREPPPVLYLPSAAAKRIGVSPSTLQRWIRTGEISTVERGGSRYVPLSEVERMGEVEAPKHRSSRPRTSRTSQPTAAERAAAARERAKMRR